MTHQTRQDQSGGRIIGFTGNAELLAIWSAKTSLTLDALLELSRCQRQAMLELHAKMRHPNDGES
jgi:hypothetical protein